MMRLISKWTKRGITCLLILFFCPLWAKGQSDQSSDYWLKQAKIFRSQAKFDSAIYCLKQVRYYAELSKNREHLATSYLDQGLYFMYQENWDSANYYYSQSLNIAEQYLKDNHSIFINAHHLQGVNYHYWGDFNRALYHSKKSLDYEIANQKNPMSIAVGLENIANSYMEKSAYDKALEYYQQAMAIYKEKGTPAEGLLGLIYLNIGVCYNRKQQNKRALTYYNQAKILLEKQTNSPKKQLISLYNSFSIAYRDENRLDKSMEYIQKALALQRVVPYKRENTLTTLGYLYLKKKMYAAAQGVLSQAFTLHPNKKHSDVAKIQLTLGESWAAENKIQKALNAYQKGIMILVQDFENTGMNNPSIKNYISSLRNLLKLLHAKAKLLSQMGKEYRLPSLETYQLASDLILQMQKSYPSVSTQLFLAKTTTKLHEEGFKIAFDAYQENPKIENLNQALFFAERTKSKLLLNNITSTVAKKTGGVPDTLIQQEKNLCLDIAFYKRKWLETKGKNKTKRQQQYQQQIFALDAKMEKLQKKLAKDYPKYYQHQQQQILPTAEKLQAKLLKSNQDLLIEYFVSNQEVYAFIIQKEFAKVVYLTNKNSLETPLKEFWNGLLNPQKKMYSEKMAFQYYTKNAQLLYSILLEPLIPKNTQQLYLVQDEQLSFLPMAALLKSTTENTAIDYLKLDYLLHYYSFGYSYSAALLLHNLEHESIDYQQSFLGFAPYETAAIGDTFKALPFSLNEVENAANLLNGRNFIGKKATFEQFCETTKASILHIASHGYVNRARPEYSYLVFKGKQHLHAFEIQNIDIEADLVVLSACETGIGQFAAGEGTLSLARSFMYARVPSVLMTLWKVRDRSSAVLMGRFYQYLRGEGTSKVEALGAAKKEYLNMDADPRTGHPYFWAAHILLGNPDVSIVANPTYKWWYGGCLVGILAAMFFLWKKRKEV